MNEAFIRVGSLKDLTSYPRWAQDLVAACEGARRAVSGHEFYRRLRDGQVSAAGMRTYLIGGWPVVEQFPLYMSQNLLKTRFGRSPGEDMARRWLMRNIRVELNHADHWLRWTEAYGVGLAALRAQEVPEVLHALGHWCWHSSASDDLAVAMAATNYAVEGVTGDWSALVCSSDAYEQTLPAELRKSAMKWLRLHAHYDDDHPWEALEIICTLCGQEIAPGRWDELRAAICKSFRYMELFLDHCLAQELAGTTRRPQVRVAG